jgi:hypothetical protein
MTGAPFESGTPVDEIGEEDANPKRVGSLARDKPGLLLTDTL